MKLSELSILFTRSRVSLNSLDLVWVRQNSAFDATNCDRVLICKALDCMEVASAIGATSLSE